MALFFDLLNDGHSEWRGKQVGNPRLQAVLRELAELMQHAASNRKSISDVDESYWADTVLDAAEDRAVATKLIVLVCGFLIDNLQTSDRRRMAYRCIARCAACNRWFFQERSDRTDYCGESCWPSRHHART